MARRVRDTKIKNLVSPASGMSVIIIPFDYEQLPASEQRAIIPICIASVDLHGKPIARVWFEQGVVPVQDQLRRFARFIVGDIRRVSELAEITVHKLWDRHGESAGICPWRRVLTWAYWEARDLAAGDSRWRINHTVPLAMGSLENDLYQNGLTDPTQYDELYERMLLVELIERRIEDDKRPDIRQMFQMLRQGYTWDEIATRFQGVKPEALKKRFWRWVDRHLRL